MAYAKRAKPNWAEALTHPRDRAIAQAERLRRAHERAWSDSANERDGRVCMFANASPGAGVLVQGYDRRAEFLQVTLPSKAEARVTLSKQVHSAKQDRAQFMRQTLGRANNRQSGGGR